MDSIVQTLVPALVVLVAAAWLVLRALTRKKRQAEIKAQIATLASQVTAQARMVADQAPRAKATIQSLRAAMQSSQKLREEEQLLDDLVVRARVLATAANADAHAEAVNALTPTQLKHRLQALQLDARRMRGIWDTLEATSWVLRRSEEAIRRTAHQRRSPDGAGRATG